MAYAAPDFGIGASSGDTTQWVSSRGQGGGASLFRTPYGSQNTEVDNSSNDDQRPDLLHPRFSGFQFGASYSANATDEDGPNGVLTDATVENIFSLGANFVRTFNGVGVRVGAGYSTADKPTGNTGNDPEVINFGAQISFGGFTFGGGYADTLDAINNGTAATGTSRDATGWDVGATYSTGPWGFSVIYYHASARA